MVINVKKNYKRNGIPFAQMIYNKLKLFQILHTSSILYDNFTKWETVGTTVGNSAER